jgi:two-component system, NtrC family, sensor kinase
VYRQVELTIKLFRIYLHDESEKANIGAIDALAHTFNAECGALFYVNAQGQYRFCLAGTDFPISLDEERWKECVDGHVMGDSVFFFNDWAPPGLDGRLGFWISAPLNSSASGPGYVFLGRDEPVWNLSEKDAFSSSIEVVGELVEIRHRRDTEALSRLEAERTLERNERRMLSFFQSSHDMIYTTDSENRFTSINRAGVELFGVDSQDDVIGRPFTDFMKNFDDTEFFMKRIREVGYISDHEIILVKADGNSVFCLQTSHAIRDEKGNIVEIQGMIKDISDRIRNERELWKMNLELSEMNMKLHQAQDMMFQHEKLASIGQLAAGVAHEINNPLGFLKSNQYTLRKYFDDIKIAWQRDMERGNEECVRASKELDLEYLFGESESIFRENEEGYARIVKIVSNLMSFSRMEQKNDLELYDVHEGIESTLVVAWNEIKYVADVTKKFGDIPKIFAHKGEINQVVLNILVNAAQAIGAQKREEKGSIEIETALEGTNVAIIIRDDGPGIPQKVISRIFDPFFTTKEPGKGTGLGLSISYDIVVTKHKGKLSVRSEEGKGTEFRIELPVSAMDK